MGTFGMFVWQREHGASVDLAWTVAVIAGGFSVFVLVAVEKYCFRRFS